MSGWNSTQKMKMSKSDFDPIFQLHEYGYNVHTNEIYIVPWNYLSEGVGEESYEPGVEHTMSSRFMMSMNLARTLHCEDPLLIHMKTNGGEWNEGIAMFDLIMTYPWDVIVLNYTHSRSMSSMIPMPATKTVMMPGSEYMFHEGYYGEEATFREARANINWYEEKASPMMLDIYSKRMKQKGKFREWDEETIKDMLQEEMERRENIYLDAVETVEWGFYDEVFDGDWDRLKKTTKEQQERASEYAMHFMPETPTDIEALPEPKGAKRPRPRKRPTFSGR